MRTFPRRFVGLASLLALSVFAIGEKVHAEDGKRAIVSRPLPAVEILQPLTDAAPATQQASQSGLQGYVSRDQKRRPQGLIGRLLAPATRPIVQELKVTQKGLAGLRQPLTDLRTPIENLERPIEDLAIPLNELKQPIENLVTPISDLRQPLLQLQNPLVDLKQPLDSLHDPLQGVANLEQPLNGLNPQLSQLKKSTQSLSEQISGLKQPINQMVRPLEGIEQPLQGLQQPLKDLQAPITNLHQEVSGLKQEVSDLRQSLSDLAHGVSLAIILGAGVIAFAIWNNTRRFAPNEQTIVREKLLVKESTHEQLQPPVATAFTLSEVAHLADKA